MTQEIPKRILGIDPGTNALGYAVIEIRKKAIHLIHLDVLHMRQLDLQAEKLRTILDHLRSVIRKHQPTECAIEAPFFGKNVQSMLKLGRAQGVAMAAVLVEGLTVTEYSPKKIKQAVTGNGNASKEQVSAMLETLTGSDLSKVKLDATDALATAICHHFQTSNGIRIPSGKKGWGNFLKDNPERILRS